MTGHRLFLPVGLAAAMVLAIPVSGNAQDKDRSPGISGSERENRSGERGRFSDRGQESARERSEKELEQALRPGHEAGFYKDQLEKMGYRITSVNQEKANYIEYEVVKSDQTFEIQIDMDEKTKKATNVDVAFNLWQAEGTKRALDQQNDRSRQGSAGSR